MTLRPRVPFFVGSLAVLAAVAVAAKRSWLCDDAFITFRYSLNLARGNGLVYNAGERVEGYTNFLWTLWCSVPHFLGFDVEPFVIVTGLVLFSVLLCRLYTLNAVGGDTSVLPWALLGAALAPALADFATCGLETCLVTLLVLTGYEAILGRQRFRAGLLFGLAVLSRPDAALLAVLAGAWILIEDVVVVPSDHPAPSRRALVLGRLRGSLAFAVAVGALVLPHLAFRIWYYGDVVPNTFHAKSGGASWWSQGAIYVGLFLGRYWPLALAPALALFAVHRSRRGRGTSRSEEWRDDRAVILALVLAVPYLVWVAKVGGDFMFARLIIPVVPLLLVVMERSIVRIGRSRTPPPDSAPEPGKVRERRGLEMAVGLVFLLGIALTPTAVDGRIGPFGIVDERRFYTETRADWAERSRAEGTILRHYFQGLPVRVAFFGGEARLVYYSDPPVAIESAAGLTDSFVARQPLPRRGRVGHEKTAPAEYLLSRRVHFTFDPAAGQITGLDRCIPYVPIDFSGVRGRIVTWDPEVLEEMSRRGARFPDIPRLLDAEAERGLGGSPETAVRRFAGLEAFYFTPARDAARRARHRALLDQASAGGDPPQ